MQPMRVPCRATGLNGTSSCCNSCRPMRCSRNCGTCKAADKSRRWPALRHTQMIAAGDQAAAAYEAVERMCAVPLYMAAISAITHNPGFQAIYQNMAQQGKMPLIAMNAVMRKMIVIINAKIRDAHSNRLKNIVDDESFLYG